MNNYGMLKLLSLVIIFAACSNPHAKRGNQHSATHEQLVKLFTEWREFHSPEMKEGVPDYSLEAMKKQQAELVDWQARLYAFDTTGWPIKNQVDWYLVWAEMNSLDFDHRVRKPWVNDPAFYSWFYSSPSDVPEREGPNIFGAVDLPNYKWPLSDSDAKDIAFRLRLGAVHRGLPRRAKPPQRRGHLQDVFRRVRARARGRITDQVPRRDDWQCIGNRHRARRSTRGRDQ